MREGLNSLQTDGYLQRSSWARHGMEVGGRRGVFKDSCRAQTLLDMQSSPGGVLKSALVEKKELKTALVNGP